MEPVRTQLPPTYTPEQLVDIGNEILGILFDGLGIENGPEASPSQIRAAVAIIMSVMMGLTIAAAADYPDAMRDAMLAFAGVSGDAS